MTTSAGFSISVSCQYSTSGRVSTSGIAAELRPPHTCDLMTMVEVVSVQLTSPECLTKGIGTSSRVADTEIDSLDRLLRPTLHVGTVSMVFSDISRRNDAIEAITMTIEI